jgi:hypothetical protein
MIKRFIQRYGHRSPAAIHVAFALSVAVCPLSRKSEAQHEELALMLAALTCWCGMPLVSLYGVSGR